MFGSMGLSMYTTSLYLPSQLECAPTLLVMVDRVKGGGSAPPTLTWLGKFFHQDRMNSYVRKWQLTLLCVLCGDTHYTTQEQK
jgi:hypothetical protein